MSITVALPEELIKEADLYKNPEKRSRAGQIEYWATMGKVALDNPDLPMEFIKDILLGLEETKHPELLQEFRFESK